MVTIVTKVPLQKWFLAITRLLNAKKSTSSQNWLEICHTTNRVVPQYAHTPAMANEGEMHFLVGVVEADETYVGGKPRKGNKPTSTGKSKRGRGTNKMAVIGAVERDGVVVAQPSDNVQTDPLHSS